MFLVVGLFVVSLLLRLVCCSCCCCLRYVLLYLCYCYYVFNVVAVVTRFVYIAIVDVVVVSDHFYLA